MIIIVCGFRPVWIETIIIIIIILVIINSSLFHSLLVATNWPLGGRNWPL